MTLTTDTVLDGKYRIVKLLGQGGMGAVYEGENVRIHRRVAIKVLHASVAAKTDVVQRFEREAQAAGRIGSEHIVEVLDLGLLPDGENYMVMEYLEGQSLGDRIKVRKRLTAQNAAEIVHQLLDGLAAAHDADIVHRDLKPDNVYLLKLKGGKTDFVKVLDFGVSKFSALDNDMSMTKTGAVMGTPYYMSPEQARGQKVDARSDLYAVGVVLYQTVTGKLPFNAESFNELVFKIALETATPAHELVPGLDPAFSSIIAKAMTREVEGRYQTSREFQAALAQWMMTSAPANANAAFASPPVPGGPSIMGNTPPQALSATPLRQSAPNLSQSGSLALSGAALSQSGPLAQSGPLGPLAQSGPLGPLGQSALFGQSGPLGQSGASLAGSQAAMSVTSQPARGNGAMILVGVFGALAVLGAGFGLFMVVGQRAGTNALAGKAPVVVVATAVPASASVPATATAAVAVAPAPAATASASAAVSASASASSPTVAVAPPTGGSHPAGLGKGKGKGAGAAGATPAPVPPKAPAGRSIGSEL